MYENEELIKQHSKLSFNGIHESFEHCDNYLFKANPVLMDKPIYLGFFLLELKKLHMWRHIMINYNHILGKKIFNYTMLMPMLSF